MAMQSSAIDRLTLASRARELRTRRARPVVRVLPSPRVNARVRPPRSSVALARHAGRGGWSITAWAFRGYYRTNAGDLAAAVAFNAMIAVVPTALLIVSVAGLVLRDEQVLKTAIFASVWAFPSGQAQDAIETALQARNNSGWFGVFSLIGFAWVGTNFVASLARAMNRVYGVRDRRFVHQRLRGFVLMLVFSVLLSAASIAATLPTFFVAQELSFYFDEWVIARGWVQITTYALALVVATGLFMVLYRYVPNARQKKKDVWPGALTAGALFVLLIQAFPIYLRVFNPGNVYGQAFLLVTLLVTWFYVLAHVLLFGTYVNATWQQRRRCRAGVPQTMVVETVVPVSACADEPETKQVA
ncbi:MAG: hypothetical protein AVDCRST_MAG49-1231 [uncultured Thermomicrobiales bacterium]|uniref:Uncharacterized protein n=1 Tax=uncultured Thermomicrobiales bacterium TaxID=1645740 RepID=A0A6J4UBH0_9BACT|nr:MAG: hypothetical protein AVDCRST_MAG49-1231 [uncultured Thermomicrobiales bacterium]